MEFGEYKSKRDRFSLAFVPFWDWSCFPIYCFQRYQTCVVLKRRDNVSRTLTNQISLLKKYQIITSALRKQ